MNNGRELIALDDVAAFFQVTVREDALAGGFTVSYRGKTIVASADQPMASVDGRIVTLPSPVVRSGRRWLVPVEFLPRALGPIYDQRIDLRRPARLLIVGDLRVPRVAARIDAAGPPTRATIVITPATPVTVDHRGRPARAARRGRRPGAGVSGDGHGTRGRHSHRRSTESRRHRLESSGRHARGRP